MSKSYKPKSAGTVQDAAQRLFDAGAHPAQQVLAREHGALDFDTLKNQIGIGNLVACGARDFMLDLENNAVMFRVGSKCGVTAKIIVALDASDTYTVRYIEFRKYELVKDELVEGVYADTIGEVVRNMGDRA